MNKKVKLEKMGGNQMTIFGTINERVIEKYKLYLSFEYGNKERLIKSLENEIVRYRSAPQTPKCISRIVLYDGIIEYAKKQ